MGVAGGIACVCLGALGLCGHHTWKEVKSGVPRSIS